MARTTGVRFRQAGKIFYYDAADLDVQVSQYVVVETSHGLSVGRIVIAPDQVIAHEQTPGEELKPILRLASPDDVEQMAAQDVRAKEALIEAKAKVAEHGLDMNLASGEFDLEGTQFTAYFTSTERVDFRNLVRDLSRDLGARVQLLQVGDRDRAKLVDGFDICGERLCCSSWMTNFPSVSIRMAKEQDLPLNPQKISGVCGRLYCCLTFEYEDYKALRGTLPKVGSFVSTPAGQARVHSIDFNREVVKLFLLDQQELVEVAAIDFQLQHGVTIRPMELVRKIEGELRTLHEDTPPTSAPPPRRNENQRGRPAARGGQAQQQPPAPQPPSTPPQRERRERRPRNVIEEAELIARAAEAKAAQQARQAQQQSTAPSGETPDAAQKRRRRRRRGRGGGGNAAGGDGGPPASE